MQIVSVVAPVNYHMTECSLAVLPQEGPHLMDSRHYACGEFYRDTSAEID
jgi:hypothetical protein